MNEPTTIRVSDRIGFDFNLWSVKQAQVDDLEGIKETADYLLEQMRKATAEEEVIISEMKKTNRWYKRNQGYYRYTKPEKAEESGYLTHIYKTNPDNPIQSFFYFDCPVRDEIIRYLIESESIKYIGRIKHQSELHKAWIIQEDEAEKEKRLKLREELKVIFTDKKKIIKSAIQLKFNFVGDYSMNSLMSNPRFNLLTEGLNDLSIIEGKKRVIYF